MIKIGTSEEEALEEFYRNDPQVQDDATFVSVPMQPGVSVMGMMVPQTPGDLLNGSHGQDHNLPAPNTPPGPPPATPFAAGLPTGAWDYHTYMNQWRPTRLHNISLQRRRERRNIYRGFSPGRATLSSEESPPFDWASPFPESQ